MQPLSGEPGLRGCQGREGDAGRGGRTAQACNPALTGPTARVLRAPAGRAEMSLQSLGRGKVQVLRLLGSWLRPLLPDPLRVTLQGVHGLHPSKGPLRILGWQGKGGGLQQWVSRRGWGHSQQEVERSKGSFQSSRWQVGVLRRSPAPVPAVPLGALEKGKLRGVWKPRRDQRSA